MIAGVLAPIVRPSTALIGRLPYAQKFVVVGLVLLIPLGFVATAYVQLQQAQIAFSAKERQGVALMAPLIELTGHAVQARHCAVAAAGTGVTLATGAPATAVSGCADIGEQVDRDLATVGALVSRLGPDLDGRGGVARSWWSVRTGLLAARRGDSITARFQAYNAAVDEVLALIVRVGDASNLTLDPDLDTYYLMDILQFRLPVMLNTAGRSVDRAIIGGADPGGVIELGLAGGVLSSSRAVVARAVATIEANTADPVVRRLTVAGFDGLQAQATALEGRLAAGVSKRDLGLVAADASDGVRTAVVRFAAQVATSLDGLLRKRIDGFSDRAHQVQLATALAVLLSAYLFMGFYVSVTTPIRRIVRTLHAVAAGDLSQRVSVDTRDELSFVARALNETVARTEVATERLAARATRDTLTALPNRALVLDRLSAAITDAARTGRLMAVLFVDLDRFKLINDKLGHEAGDAVLRTVAARLATLVRSTDTVGRLAGDEFVVVGLHLAAAADAVDLAHRIVGALSSPITVVSGGAEREACVGASVGIALAGSGCVATPEEMLRDADVAMYRAKQNGRGRVEIFDEGLRVAVERKLRTEDDLRGAIGNGEIRPHYQPIIDTMTGAVLGFEALARWQHPTRGLLSAGEFIDVAEESGLIVPLGAEILGQACAQAARWRAEIPGGADLRIAVNAASAQFGHASFVSTVATVLHQTGLDPGALWLEITETTVMADAEATDETMRALRALGVLLVIDDFGTGYSSLEYLRRFPVEALKIDRSFVAGIGRNREDDAIVEMILGLANALDLHVVAEGVENAGQLERLRSLGCHMAQGFHCGRPVAAQDVWKASDQRDTLTA